MSHRYARALAYQTRNPRAVASPLRSAVMNKPGWAVFGPSWHDGTWSQPKAAPAPVQAAVINLPPFCPSRELANAEAALREMRRCYVVARAGIGEANRTVIPGDRHAPDRRLSPERVRERKSYAFKLLNRRRRELTAAERGVAAARIALTALAS